MDEHKELYRWVAEEEVEQHRISYESGNRVALFGAIRICAAYDLPLPKWAAKAFIAGHDKILNCEASSWDAAFGRPFPKGVHLARARTRRRVREAVYNEVLRMAATKPVGDSLFEIVGSKFGIGKTLANELYDEAKLPWGSLHRLPRKL